LLAPTSPKAVKETVGLTLLFYVPGVIHRAGAVEKYRAQRRYGCARRVPKKQEAVCTPPLP